MICTYKETASGVKLDLAERKRVMALAQRREIAAVLVTELSRWSRSTIDLLATLRELETRRVSLVALNGVTSILRHRTGAATPEQKYSIRDCETQCA